MRLAAVATAAGVAYVLGRLTSRVEVVAARREASTDALTGLTNRAGLMRQLHNRTRRRYPHAVLLFDLNGFKRVNDTYGHRAGDELLMRLADRLARHLDGHLLARLGGDEFVIVVDGARPAEAELGFADQVLGIVRMPITLAGVPERVSLGAAIGIARWIRDEDSSVTLHAADLAMYRSKALGRPHLVTVRTLTAVDPAPVVRRRDTRPVRVA